MPFFQSTLAHFRACSPLNFHSFIVSLLFLIPDFRGRLFSCPGRLRRYQERGISVEKRGRRRMKDWRGKLEARLTAKQDWRIISIGEMEGQ